VSATPTSVQRATPAEIVGGFLAAVSIFASIVSIAWHPLRLVIASILLALISAGLSGRHQRLAGAAVGIGALSFVLGMSFAVLTSHPLW
jgi:hypothetical protein